MPPKAARGGLTARGRGRGRGRGKAAASSAAETPQSESESPSSTVGGSSSQPADSQLPAPQSTASQPAAIPPAWQYNLPDDDDYDGRSPNSSPATVPTETPAPTPMRSSTAADNTGLLPVVGSTEGSATRGPSTRGASSARATRGGLSTRGTRGGLSSRGTRGVMHGGGEAEAAPKPSRFKPKAIRRDAGEREEIARHEQLRLDQISAAAARAEARAARSRGRGGRGRGDAMGRGGMSRGGGSASGIFGIVPEGLGKAPGGFVMRRDGGGGGGGGGSSADGPRIIRSDSTNRWPGSGEGGQGAGGRDKNWFPEPRYPDDDGRTPRINIENINMMSDDEDEPVITGSRRVRPKSSEPKPLKPIRLEREEHKPRVTIVNTDPTIKADIDGDSDVDLTVDEFKSSQPQPHSDAAETLRIKAEPGLAEPLFHTTSREGSIIMPDSPDSKRIKKLEPGQSTAIILDSTSEDEVRERVKREKKARRKSEKKDKKPIIQTEEDREEYERHVQDVAILAEELGGLQGRFKGKLDAEGDLAMDEDKDDAPDPLEGRLYLFQFPPVLPLLYNPETQEKPEPNGGVKSEENKVKGEKDDVVMKDIPVKTPKIRSGMKLPIDLTNSEDSPAAVKFEPNPNLSAADAKKLEDEKKKKRKEVVHESGWIGKLVVRESGKVELCWGGTSLVVSRGATSNFLTQGVIVDSVEKGPPGGGAPEGKAWGMGEIKGKFVVTPDWEKLT